MESHYEITPAANMQRSGSYIQRVVNSQKG